MLLLPSMKSLCNKTVFRQTNRTVFKRAQRATVKSMATLTVYVKGDPVNKVLWDCPFCHRVLLTLETKSVPYERTFIDFANKPEWLHERSSGKVPVINQGDFWLPDSDSIVAWLEEHYPAPSMKSDVPADVGAKFFPSFTGFLKSTPEDAAEKEAALLAELKTINDYLSEKGPLFGGSNLNATDASLAPKLYHCKVALKHFKGWEFPSDLPALPKYFEALAALPAWQKSLYGEDIVIKGWAPKVQAV